MTDNEIREAWRTAGGGFHGPIVETATMPEADMFRFVRGVVAAEREACAKVCNKHSANQLRHGAIELAEQSRQDAMMIRERSNAQ